MQLGVQTEQAAHLPKTKSALCKYSTRLVQARASADRKKNEIMRVLIGTIIRINAV